MVNSFFLHQIADALFEIMLPRFSGDILPKTVAGTVLAITDRYANDWLLPCLNSMTTNSSIIIL